MPHPGALANDSAMKNLAKAFDRWQKANLYIKDRAPAQALVQRALSILQYSPEELRIPGPAAFAFVESLELLEPSKLPEDSRECPICVQPYRLVSEQMQNNRTCVAVRLPCKHVVGKWCLLKWVNPFDDVNNNQCPYCRREFFPKFHSMECVVGLQQRVDLIDWCTLNLGRVSSESEKEQIADWTKLIVSSRLVGARQELQTRMRRTKQLLREDGLSGEEVDQWTPDAPRQVLELHFREALLHEIELQVENADLREQLADEQALLRIVDEDLRQTAGDPEEADETSDRLLHGLLTLEERDMAMGGEVEREHDNTEQ